MASTDHHDRERTWAGALTAAEADQLTALLQKLMTGPAPTSANRRS